MCCLCRLVYCRRSLLGGVYLLLFLNVKPVTFLSKFFFESDVIQHALQYINSIYFFVGLMFILDSSYRGLPRNVFLPQDSEMNLTVSGVVD